MVQARGLARVRIVVLAAAAVLSAASASSSSSSSGGGGGAQIPAKGTMPAGASWEGKWTTTFGPVDVVGPRHSTRGDDDHQQERGHRKADDDGGEDERLRDGIRIVQEVRRHAVDEDGFLVDGQPAGRVDAGGGESYVIELVAGDDRNLDAVQLELDAGDGWTVLPTTRTGDLHLADVPALPGGAGRARLRVTLRDADRAGAGNTLVNTIDPVFLIGPGSLFADGFETRPAE